MRSRRRSTRVIEDQSYLEGLRALQRLYVSGGGGAEKASGEASRIPAASSGFVLRPAHTSRTFTDAEINNLSILAKLAGR